MSAPIVTNYPPSTGNLAVIGVKPDGTPCLITCDSDGKLDVGLSFTGTVNVGEVSFSQVAGENNVVVGSSALPTGAATQTTSEAILAKLIAAPATEAKQDTGNTSLAAIAAGMATQTTLAAILAKLIAAPATEATLAALNAKVTAMNSGATVIASGAVTATGPTVTRVNSTAYEISRVISNAACTLVTLSGYNSGPGQFIQLFDSATVPADGVAPVWVIGIPAASSFAIDFGTSGLPFASGCAVANSTTGPTKTQGSANCFFTATKR